MSILYNNQLLEEEEFRLSLLDRAFQYNDGFFETAIIADGSIRFWNSHKQRMQEAATALQLNLPARLLSREFEETLLKLAEAGKALSCGRLKLKVWRAGEGLYTPQTNDLNWLATVAPATPAGQNPIHVGICQKVTTAYTPLSHFKGPNAPLYVLAGLEKQAQQQDDMLLLNQQGKVAELISSNLFWLKGDILYTPSLEAGCVNGILRRNILQWCLDKLEVQEVLQESEVLRSADAVFAANITGIRSIASIDQQYLNQQEVLIEKLRQELKL
ncbi:aminotransferase class IV [Pontibacter korlensis]|uniref:aminotransferase class IV n=1 Tax=Pontibacter korlensis TaxID=400092 RepID=UPI00061ADA5C|nr:aminotransferase class IV [Pontibacter korlensis]